MNLGLFTIICVIYWKFQSPVWSATNYWRNWLPSLVFLNLLIKYIRADSEELLRVISIELKAGGGGNRTMKLHSLPVAQSGEMQKRKRKTIALCNQCHGRKGRSNLEKQLESQCVQENMPRLWQASEKKKKLHFLFLFFFVWGLRKPDRQQHCWG